MKISPEKVDRISNQDLDGILGIPFKVLDDGFVRVIDYMGNDSAIVQAARVSYGIGTRQLNEDKGLIRYLMRHDHTTPFEMCEIKLHIRVPMDTWRQWIRHRTASVNEYSTRYSIAIDASQKTDPGSWRLQSKSNKQGSSGYLSKEAGIKLSQEEDALQKKIFTTYEDRIEQGVAREQARKDLPLSTYTEAYWKIDLHNLFHFLRLRMDSHAQFEIRSYANIIGEEIIKKWCPIAWEAFVDYKLNALYFSARDIKVLSFMQMEHDQAKVKNYLKELGYFTSLDKKSRELEELEKKLIDHNFSVPW